MSAAPASPPRHVLLLADAANARRRTLAEEIEPWLRPRVERLERVDDPIAWEKARQNGDRGPRPDLVVVVGGDGALLGVIRAFADDPPPTLGIHAGVVGFLASTTASRWRETLAAVLEGTCILEHRMRLSVQWKADGEERTAVALNEIVVQRGSHQGMLVARLEVGGEWLTDYRADGVIVATPSGSTAYSLSAGGPILEPSVPGLVVTPLCSQGLSNRPIVVSSERAVTIDLLSSGGLTTLSVDGQAFFPLRQGTRVRLERHPEPYPLYAMPGLDPYRRLRSRLGWGSAKDEEPPRAGGRGSEPDPLPEDAGAEGGL